MKIYYLPGFLFVLILVAIVSCQPDYTQNIQNSTDKQFYDYTYIEPIQEDYLPGDTIWMAVDFADTYKDANSSESITLQNQTFMTRVYINLLTTDDSTSFLDNNFKMVEDKGDFKLVSVLNTSSQLSVSFDIRSGQPSESNYIRFGLIPNYPGIFAAELSTWVYFGANRTNYDDFSSDIEKGFIDLSFNADSLNDSLYYSLPDNLRYYFESYYNSIKISNNKFFFFKVLNLDTDSIQAVMKPENYFVEPK